MALRNIRVEKESCLYAKSRTVEVFDDRLQTLIDDMMETMLDADGAGLAAPQVGILKRVITVNPGEEPYALVNPEITYMSEDTIGSMEGCLSFPGKFGWVERAAKVHVNAQKPDGTPIELDAEDFEARILQHEIDHLNGIVYITRVTEPPADYPERNHI